MAPWPQCSYAIAHGGPKGPIGVQYISWFAPTKALPRTYFAAAGQLAASSECFFINKISLVQTPESTGVTVLLHFVLDSDYKLW